MKIVMINARFRTGSTGDISYDIYQKLVSCGHECFMFCSIDEDKSKNVFRVGNVIDHKIHAFLTRLTGKQAYFSTFATIKMIRQIDRIKPNIVHLHNLHNNYINIKLLLKYLAKNNIATVITLHDCWFFTGKCAHYTEANCYNWQNGCGNCPQLKNDTNSWFFDNTNKVLRDRKKLLASIKNLNIIGVSRWITEEAKKSILKDAKRIVCLYNWVDTDIFHPVADAYKENKEKPILLSVSSVWSKIKTDELLRLSKEIGDRATIKVVGEIDANIALPQNIIYTKHIKKQADLARLYTEADVYVNLSHEDTFGKVIVESFACGTPVVAFDRTSYPELVTNGCGFIVKTGDTKMMCKKIFEIIEGGKKTYLNNCVGYVKNNFNKKEQLEKLVEFYKSVLE